MLSSAPRLEFPDELPVSRLRADIAALIAANQVVIITGETGSGKTTQIPKILLQLGYQSIAHTQPRRIAARTIAARIAAETATELGTLVGYQVRFTEQLSANTQLRLITDGILLNAIQHDRDLRAFDAIIIDEAHERSLNIDFLLGYLRLLLPRRPDLKLIITSATIDPGSFAKHFADPHSAAPAPVLQVSGRSYPVEIRYRPHPDQIAGIVAAVNELGAEQPGDILVFLSGESEIRDAQEALEQEFNSPNTSKSARTEILPLYGRLSAAEQQRAFQPRQAARRIVLATNVAETSLTVPGIRYVIDTGWQRTSRYSTRSKVQQLPIVPIPQASANQRAGRAGRTSPGIVIRLFSAEDYQARPEFAEPEIKRTGLASVILQLLSLGITELSDFPFLTPPDPRGWRDGITQLHELGAVAPLGSGGRKKYRITKLGRQLARLPLEPRFARMVLAAKPLQVVPEVLIVVAGLTAQDVRERPQEKRAIADQQHARFADPTGDIITLLQLWNYLQELQKELSGSAFRKRLKNEFLNYLRVREWCDLVQQLSRIAGHKKPITVVNGAADAVHKAVLAGLLSQLGAADPKPHRKDPQKLAASSSARPAAREYSGPRGSRFVIHPGSALAKKPPHLVMAAELVATSRLFARQVAAIDPAWVESLGGAQLKRKHASPKWDSTTGSATALETLTLHGVPIITNRRCQLQKYDAHAARELFIRHALVAGEWYTQAEHSPHAFDRANWHLRHELQALAERSRSPELIYDEDTIFEFYTERIPASVCSVSEFEAWWQKTRSSTPKLLHMSRAELSAAAATHAANFPREWHHGDQTLQLRYRYEPGASDDGLTVQVPLPLLPRIAAADFQKTVPGLREELVTALLRTLPKTLRRHVVPAADWGRELLAAVTAQLHTAPLTELLAAEIKRRTSQQITAADFVPAKLPAHLTPTFQVIDHRGRTIGSGKDLAQLQSQHQELVAQGITRVATQNAASNHEFTRQKLHSWDFAELPEMVTTTFSHGRAGGVVRAYPAIVDRRKHVDLVLLSEPDQQQQITRRGVRRLLSLSTPSPASYIREHLSNQEKMLLAAGPFHSLDDAIADVSLAVADQVLLAHYPDAIVRTREQFQELVLAYERSLIEDIYAGIALTARVLDAARSARKALHASQRIEFLGQLRAIATQVDALVPQGPAAWGAAGLHGNVFVSHTGLQRLGRIPVYLRAISERLAALPGNPGRDRTRQNEIDQAVQLFAQAGGAFPLPPDSSQVICDCRWLIEEFHISLFAQQLGTAQPVSLQRIQKLLRGI